jgi:hypothetical protein
VSNSTVTQALPAAARDGGAGIYANFTYGEGGNAARYTPPTSFWASADFQPTGRWQEMHLRSPSGLAFGQLLPHAPYAAAPANGAVLHYWRPAHWYSAFARVGAAATDEGDRLAKSSRDGGEKTFIIMK